MGNDSPTAWWAFVMSLLRQRRRFLEENGGNTTVEERNFISGSVKGNGLS